MHYQDTLSYIHSFPRFGERASLDRIRYLLDALGNPQDSLKFVHIAGTNGKGSVTMTVSHILKEAGYRTGTFISPYIVDFRERMQVDLQMISQQQLCEVTQDIRQVVDPLLAKGVVITQFELVTAIGLVWFARQHCDIVCMEVGLGGKYDPTNIISHTLVAAITLIDFDHTQILGDSTEKIAVEKCGIIKPGCTVVSYPCQPDEALAVIMETCFKTGCPLVLPSFGAIRQVQADLNGCRFHYDGMDLHTPLCGIHQIYNGVMAVEVVKALAQKGFPATPLQIRDGMKKVFFPARMERLCDNPLTILDGAHNPSGIHALSQFISDHCKYPIIAVTGMLKDKDVESSMAQILPHCKKVITLAVDSPRTMTAEELAEIAGKYCADCTAADTIDQALALAGASYQDGDVILLFGSLYLAAQLRRKFSKS